MIGPPSWLEKNFLSPKMTLELIDRKSGERILEPVFSENVMRFLYGPSALGQLLERFAVGTRSFGKLYGLLQDLPLDSDKLAHFCENLQIRTEDFEEGPYDTFNEFFIRRFRAGMRPFDPHLNHLAAPCEGRVLGFDRLSESSRLPIKGQSLSIFDLYGGDKLLPKEVQDSTAWRSLIQAPEQLSAIVFRLAPRDYHRFHFPCEGTQVGPTWRVSGRLRSVHPYSLRMNASGDTYLGNERQISLLDSESFGPLLMIEVGALTVGKIIQSHSPQLRPFKRGEEKGYFLFGGSTAVLVFSRNRARVDSDLLQHTRQGLETLVQLGTRIAATTPLSG